MYASQYKKLFWAIILIIFNINIGTIDILPNFVGYILICSAVKSLKNQNAIFEKAFNPSLLLVFMSFKQLLNVYYTNTGMNIFFIVFDAVLMLINVYVIYILCIGICLSYSDKISLDLRESVRARWIFYLSCNTISLFYFAFSINFGDDFKVFGYILAFIYIITSLLIAFLFRRVSSETERVEILTAKREE